jgi:S-DNA-T family DNA segregation ATPase FtsK/SpoIIIE
MFISIIKGLEHFNYYDKYEIYLDNLYITINDKLTINDKNYHLNKKIYYENDYIIFINPKRNKFYANYKYQKLTHLEISCNKNTMIQNIFLDKIVFIDDNLLTTDSNYVFINNVKTKTKQLKENDIIEIFDLRIIYCHLFYLINDKKLKINRFKIKEFHKYYNYTIVKAKINYRKQLKKPIVNHQLKNLNISTVSDNNNVFLTILPSVVMSLSSVTVGLLSAYNAYVNNRSINEIIIFLILPISMLISSIVIMPLQHYLNKKRQKLQLETEYVKYELYLDELFKVLKNKLEDYNDYLNSRYFNFKQLLGTENLYNKQKFHDDYLNICIGQGIVKTNFKMKHSIKDERILKRIDKYNRSISILNNNFIELSLLNYKYISIVNSNNYFGYLLLQLISYYPAGCFNMVAILNEKQLNNKYYLKYINHFNYHGTRLIAKNSLNIKEINKLLENSDKDNIIIVYDTTLINYVNLKATYLIICESENIYPESDVVIDSKENKYYLNKDEFDFEFNSGNIEKRIIELNNYKFSNEQYAKIKTSLYELFNIDSINKLVTKDYNRSLDTIIGYNFENEQVSLDIHENGDGAHGLIVGTTGSGKSELIISLLLSLAMNYSPKVLNMVIIDFKGTTIISNLVYKKFKLPHVINSLSNIDESTIERALCSFKIECKKRMILFKRMSELTNESSMNIDLYQQVFKEEYNLDYLAHLLIVIDEFAELKSNNDYFIGEIISLARIGRSLGIHLLLSTQKVSGVVSEEILANISYRICLKLNDVSESKMIIGTKDAYYIKNPGEFYLYHNQELTNGRSVMSSVTSDIKSLSEKVIILDNMMHELHKSNIRKSNSLKQNEAIVKYLNNLYRFNCSTLWLDKLTKIKYEELLLKYKDSAKLVLGEYDDINKREQGVMNYDINTNAVLFSLNSDLKSSFISNLLYGFNRLKSKMIIIDFSHSGFINFVGCKNIIDVSEDIKHTYDIFNFLEKRLKLDKLLVVINNACTLYREYPDLSERLFVLMNESYKTHITFLIVANNYQSVNFKHLNIIKNKYALDIKSKTELINIFDEIPVSYEEGIYFDGNYYNFKLALNSKEINKLIYDSCDEIVQRIPKIIKFEINKDKILLGYNLQSYKKIYHDLSKKLLITSFDFELIEIYRVEYSNLDNIDVISFNNNICNNYNFVLFLKQGIRKQFIFDNDIDVKNEDEAIYIRNHKVERIKYANEGLCKL